MPGGVPSEQIDNDKSADDDGRQCFRCTCSCSRAVDAHITCSSCLNICCVFPRVALPWHRNCCRRQCDSDIPIVAVISSNAKIGTAIGVRRPSDVFVDAAAFEPLHSSMTCLPRWSIWQEEPSRVRWNIVALQVNTARSRLLLSLLLLLFLSHLVVAEAISAVAQIAHQASAIRWLSIPIIDSNATCVSYCAVQFLSTPPPFRICFVSLYRRIGSSITMHRLTRLDATGADSSNTMFSRGAYYRSGTRDGSSQCSYTRAVAQVKAIRQCGAVP